MPSQIDRRVFAAGFLAGAFAAPAAFAQSGGRDGDLIERRESRYNTIFVRRQGPYIAMMFGVNRRLFTESLYNPRDPRELPVAYTRYMTAALAYPTQLSNVLEIGLGGGRTAHYLHLHMPQVRITCVELDPEVIALAQRHFGVRQDQRLRIVERDGRMFLRQAQDRYDLIMVDAYRGTFVPFHLLTREFFLTAKRKLAPGGAVAQNIEPSTMLFPSAVATLKAVFANVDLYQAEGNVVAIAYDGAAKTGAQLRARAQALQTAHRFRHNLTPLLSARRIAPARAGARVLTDDFAPVESLRAIDRHNTKRRD
jgi:spermidine synthase